MLFILLVGFIVFIFGGAIGSFISAMVFRLHKKESILTRSYCPKCGYKLGFFDLFPVFSFVFLRGKCKQCKKGIELQDFFIEVATGLVFVFAFFSRWIYAYTSTEFSLLVIRDWIFLGGLIFLFVYDFRHKLLPDKITFPLIAILFVYNFLLGANILNLLLAIAIGSGFFLLQYLLSRGRWIGDGDIRMGALLGAGLGFPKVVLAIFIAYIIGGIFSAILLLMKKAKMKTEIAFGTFLAVGGAAALFFGKKIINWYLGLL